MKADTLLEVLDKFSNKRVLIIGDVMLDEVKWGEVHRISPEAPVPVVELQRTTWTLGGAANAAANVATLSGRAMLGGVVGKDAQGDRIVEALTYYNIENGLLTDPDRPTTTKTRIIAHSQQIVRVDLEERRPFPQEMEDDLLEWVDEHVSKIDAVLLSDYAKGLVTSRIAEGIIKSACGAGKPIAVDPKGRDYRKYRRASVLTPNLQEARLALNHLLDIPDSLTEIGQRLLTLLEGSAVLITRGSEGMTLFQPRREALHIPTVARHVYDVTGAGDTVIATLVLSLAAGADLEEAAHLANTAAGIVVGKVGTATISLEELRAAICMGGIQKRR